MGVTLPFDEGRKFARALKGIETEESYLNLMKSKTIPYDDPASRLPYRPDLMYKNEWLSWDDFLVGKRAQHFEMHNIASKRRRH